MSREETTNTSRIDEQLRKMGRRELVEVIYALQQHEYDQAKQINKLQSQLNERALKMTHAGSLAEASLALSGIFDKAQEAVDQYVLSVYTSESMAKDRADQLTEDAKRKADSIIYTASQCASDLVREAQTAAETLLFEAQAKANRIIEDAESTACEVLAKAQAAVALTGASEIASPLTASLEDVVTTSSDSIGNAQNVPDEATIPHRQSPSLKDGSRNE